MGSIHERLQGLQEGLALEEATKAEHVRKKNETRSDPDLIHQARLLQYEKYKKLESVGIIDMIADATEGLELKKDEPLHLHDKTNVDSVWKRMFPARQDAQEWINKTRGNKNTLKSMIGALHWSYEIPEPEVMDDFSFDTSLTILLRRESRPSRGTVSLSHDHEKERVTLKFDGVNLQIQGSETVFDGAIPEDPDVRQNDLENAFVEAFYSPQKIEQAQHFLDSWDQRLGSE